MSFFRKKQYLVLLSGLGGQFTTNNGKLLIPECQT